jgi:alpha-tubulin suppressor-like RCC1 family protein
MRVVDFGIKASIKLVSASLNFVHFITANGLLYSQGKNKKGELGLGFCSKDVMIP